MIIHYVKAIREKTVHDTTTRKMSERERERTIERAVKNSLKDDTRSCLLTFFHTSSSLNRSEMLAVNIPISPYSEAMTKGASVDDAVLSFFLRAGLQLPHHFYITKSSPLSLGNSGKSSFVV